MTAHTQDDNNSSGLWYRRDSRAGLAATRVRGVDAKQGGCTRLQSRVRGAVGSRPSRLRHDKRFRHGDVPRRIQAPGHILKAEKDDRQPGMSSVQ